jgi:hypothetical protein
MVQNLTLKRSEIFKVINHNQLVCVCVCVHAHAHVNYRMEERATLTIVCEMFSLSMSSSDRFLVPNTFRSVVAASKRVECE